MHLSVPNRTGTIVLIAVFAALGCGETDTEDEPAVPIESIPDDKPIDDLSDAEAEGVCVWAKELAREELPPAGTRVDCNGFEIQIGAARCTDFDDCGGTIGEYETCLPNVMSRIGDDPCQLLRILTDEDAQYFIESTPGCMGLDGCAYAL